MASKNNKYSPNKDTDHSYEHQDGGFKEFLWNGATGQFLGRTGGSWFKITVFYIFYFAALAGFSWLMFHVFSFTLYPDRPKWLLGESLIGTNPGIGFRPMPDQDGRGSTLIRFLSANKDDRGWWAQQLVEYIDRIKNANESAALQSCTLATLRDKKAKASTVCKLDVSNLGPCQPSTEYGFGEGRPCILIKLNKIFGWEPLGYGTPWDWETDTRLEGPPTKNSLNESLTIKVEQGGMPSELREYILWESLRYEETSVAFKNFINTVWISCEGENPADKENIGPVAYYPSRGIPSYYFPFANQKEYKSPFVMIQLQGPYPGPLINVECKAWAHNIVHERQTRSGSVHFEIMMD